MRVELDTDQLAQAIADRLAAQLSHLTGVSPWLDASEAAAYLRCPLSRIRALTATGELPHHRDGRRVLYRRGELDAYVLAGGAKLAP